MPSPSDQRSGTPATSNNVWPSYRPRTEPLPRNIEAVTPAWLTRTLQHRYPELVVNGFETVKVVTGHTTKVRLKLDLNAAGKAAGIPEHVCLKGNFSGHPLSDAACALEARFYRDVRDAVEVPAPACYYADWDDTDGRLQGIVLMEDLIIAGGKFGSSAEPLTIDEAAEALSGYADLHAGLWGSPKLEQFTWLETSMVAVMDSGQYHYLSEYIEANVLLEDRIAILPKWVLDEPARLGRAFDKLTAHELKQTGPRCLIHGDGHLGNTYARADGKRIFIDFQLVRKGRPWRDITYFLIGALRIEDRRKADRDLLRHYLEELTRRGVVVPSFEYVWNEFRLWPTYGMVSWLANTDAWGQKTIPALERFYTAAADLDTLNRIEAD